MWPGVWRPARRPLPVLYASHLMPTLSPRLHIDIARFKKFLAAWWPGTPPALGHQYCPCMHPSTRVHSSTCCRTQGLQDPTVSAHLDAVGEGRFRHGRAGTWLRSHGRPARLPAVACLACLPALGCTRAYCHASCPRPNKVTRPITNPTHSLPPVCSCCAVRSSTSTACASRCCPGAATGRNSTSRKRLTDSWPSSWGGRPRRAANNSNAGGSAGGTGSAGGSSELAPAAAYSAASKLPCACRPARARQQGTCFAQHVAHPCEMHLFSPSPFLPFFLSQPPSTFISCAHSLYLYFQRALSLPPRTCRSSG